MRVVIQRSKKSSVSVKNEIIGSIDFGFVLLVGFTENDTIEDIEYMIHKIINLRIFDDENGVMNKNIQEVGGSILSISQFTLYAETKKGNRPSYIKALPGSEAKVLYDIFNKKLSELIETKTGIFGEDMLVSIQNDGPITIMIDTKEK